MVIEGVVEDIIYKNAENGYCVLRLETKDDGIVAVGTLPLVSEGETLELEGDYTEHKTYGRQFSVTWFPFPYACGRDRNSPISFVGNCQRHTRKDRKSADFRFRVPSTLADIFSKTNPNVSAR